MNNEKMNQMIGEAYENYCMSYKDGHEFYEDEKVKRSYTKEEFINKCKNNPEFSETWGLKIEERELSYAERYDMHINYITESNLDLLFELADDENLNRLGVPAKIITVTYNNEKIEIYE